MHAATAERLLAHCLRHTDPASAEDAVAEAYVIAWRKRDELPDDPMGWLVLTARNVIRNQQRSLWRRRSMERGLVPLADLVAPAPDGGVVRRRQLADALEALPASEREALLLVTWDGLSAADAATVLKSTPGAVRVRVHRARARLKESLGQGGDHD